RYYGSGSEAGIESRIRIFSYCCRADLEIPGASHPWRRRSHSRIPSNCGSRSTPASEGGEGRVAGPARRRARLAALAALEDVDHCYGRILRKSPEAQTVGGIDRTRPKHDGNIFTNPHTAERRHI